MYCNHEWTMQHESDKAYQTADRVQYKNGFIDAIEKACKWLEEQSSGGWIESETEELIDEFKKKMENEKD